QQHHGETVDRVARLTAGRGQAGQGVVGPVDEAVSVDEHQLLALVRGIGIGLWRLGGRCAAVHRLLGHGPRSRRVGVACAPGWPSGGTEPVRGPGCVQYSMGLAARSTSWPDDYPPPYPA